MNTGDGWEGYLRINDAVGETGTCGVTQHL